MPSFPMLEEVRPVLFGSSVSVALGASSNPYSLVIPRQSRRLATIFLHANVTIATPTGTTSRDALEAFISQIALVASDKAGSSRTVRKAGSATLLSWNRRMLGRNGRFSLTAFGKKAAATYDIVVPIHLADPTMGETAAVKTSMPLWSTDQNGNGLGEDLRLEITLNTAAGVGLSAGTVTVNYMHANLHYYEGAEAVGYVPTELIANDREWGSGGGELTFEIPDKGWLASILHEGFTSATARGDVQASGQSFWQLFYGRSQRAVWTTKLAQELDGLFMQEFPTDIAPGSTVSETGIWMKDLVGTPYSPQSFGPGALPNLYLANAGDRAYLKGTNISANATSRFTLYKFLVNDLGVLTGA